MNEQTNHVPNTALIIVDHGSRRAESNESLMMLVQSYRAGAPASIVEAAHMELASPSIADAFDACVAQGAKKVICFPFFLSPGRHWHEDIPKLVAKAAKQHSGVQWLVTAPIGRHPLLHTIITDRIDQCVAHATAGGDDCELCHGTTRCTFHEVEI